MRKDTPNVGTMTGKDRELAELMEREVYVLMVQETIWNGSGARSIGAGFKLNHGVAGEQNGKGMVPKEKPAKNVIKVYRGWTGS